MSEAKSHDAFLAELQGLIAEDDVATEVPQEPKVQAHKAQPAPKVSPTPSSQPEVAPASSSAPAAPVTPAAKPKAVPVDGEVKLEAADALAGALVFSESERGEIEPVEKPVTKQKRGSAADKVKTAAGLLVLVAAGYLLMPGAGGVADVEAEPQQAAQVPVQVPAQTPAPVASTAPAGVVAPQVAAPAPVDAAATSVGLSLDLSAMADSPQSQAALVAEIARDTKVLPESEKSCSSGELSTYDRRVCGAAGHIRFFQCTQNTGRIWDVRLPGCDIS